MIDINDAGTEFSNLPGDLEQKLENYKYRGWSLKIEWIDEPITPSDRACCNQPQGTLVTIARMTNGDKRFAIIAPTGSKEANYLMSVADCSNIKRGKSSCGCFAR